MSVIFYERPCIGKFLLDHTFLSRLIVVDRIGSGVPSEPSVGNPTSN